MTDQQKFMLTACAMLGLIVLVLAVIAEAMLSGALRPIVHVHPPRPPSFRRDDIPTWQPPGGAGE